MEGWAGSRKVGGDSRESGDVEEVNGRGGSRKGKDGAILRGKGWKGRNERGGYRGMHGRGCGLCGLYPEFKGRQILFKGGRGRR